MHFLTFFWKILEPHKAYVDADRSTKIEARSRDKRENRISESAKIEQEAVLTCRGCSALC